MSKRNKYTIKKHKSKGGTEKKKAKTTKQARRTPKEKNEDFMRVLHKTHNRLERYRKKGETDWLTDEDLKIRDRDMLTAMNTANNATLKGGKRKIRKTRKTKKSRKTRSKRGGNNEDDLAMIRASIDGEKDIVSLLLYKANLNARDNHGRTALIAASEFGHEKILHLLLAKKPDLNARNFNGETAVIAASRQGHEGILLLLITSGADLNTKDVVGNTALMQASFGIEKTHTDIVRHLLDPFIPGGHAEKANVNAKADNGDTALIIASCFGRVEIVRMLLEAGADVHIENNKGNTAYRCAVKSRKTEVADILKSHIARLEEKHQSKLVMTRKGFSDLGSKVSSFIGGKNRKNKSRKTSKARKKYKK